MICTFTGHRPERLPWGADETDERCMALKFLIAQAVGQAYDDGFRKFLCGMARGCDFYFAQAVLDLRCVHPEVRLTAMVPCPSQADGWDAAQRARHAALCAQADEVCVFEPVYSGGCMLRRNRAMVDAARRVITVYDGGEGGTAYTVRYARQTGRQIVALWQ